MKKTKCYNFYNVSRMLGLDVPYTIHELTDFLNLAKENGVEVFEPIITPGSSRARKRKITYLKSNKWLDNYIKQHNLIAMLVNRPIVKPTYAKYEEPHYDGLFK